MKMNVKMVALVALMAWIGAVVMAVAAPQLLPLAVEEKAQFGATHVIEVNYNDFSTYTTTNTSCVITSAIPAGSFVEFRLMKLESAFDNALTNTYSMTVIAGTAADDDLFLASQELASDGTEIFTAPRRANAVTVVDTNMAATVSTFGELYCTSATNVLTKLAPKYSHMLSSNTVGRVKLYWRIYRYNE